MNPKEKDEMSKSQVEYIKWKIGLGVQNSLTGTLTKEECEYLLKAIDQMEKENKTIECHCMNPILSWNENIGRYICDECNNVGHPQPSARTSHSEGLDAWEYLNEWGKNVFSDPLNIDTTYDKDCMISFAEHFAQASITAKQKEWEEEKAELEAEIGNLQQIMNDLRG